MMPSLGTRPPVGEEGEEGEEIGDADVAVAVEVGRAVRLRRARTATCQQREKVGCADGDVIVEVLGADRALGSPRARWLAVRSLPPTGEFC